MKVMDFIGQDSINKSLINQGSINFYFFNELKVLLLARVGV